MLELKTFSLLIAWSDTDRELGDFGTTVRAPDLETAERMARLEMAATEGLDFDPDDPPGGRVLESAEGAMWRAKDLEEALRALLAMVNTHCSPSTWTTFDEVHKQATAVIAGLDALPAYRKVITDHVLPPTPTQTSGWRAYFDGDEESGPYGWGETAAEAIKHLYNHGA